MPFLSIIIPVYKVEPYLRECLDSISASPLDCWEAILIDDGSPDGCPQICNEYAAKDSRFRVIHQKNYGVAVARNTGLDAAQGEWVWFVDSDDVVDMRPVGEMVEWLNENGNENDNGKVDLVMFDMKTFKDGEDVSNNELNEFDELNKSEGAPVLVDVNINKNEFLLKHDCYHHPRLWYKRSIINGKIRIRFTKGIRLAEDLEFQYKYLTLCQHPVKFDVTLYYYRLRGSSVTGDAAYRAKAVKDLPFVLKNLAVWSKEQHVKPEPWYDFRIMKLLQNLLYSASQVYSHGKHRKHEKENDGAHRLNNSNSHEKEEGLDAKAFQRTVRDCVNDYRALGFPFVNNIKIRLANWNVRGYFLFNKVYLKVKHIE